MPAQLNYDKQTAIANTLAKISAATGINNFTKTSLIRAFSEATASDIAFFNTSMSALFNQYYIQYAEGTFLDIKGTELGIQRAVSDFIFISKDDQAIQLEPTKTGQSFKTVYGSLDPVPDGLALTVYNSRVNVTVNEDITFPPNDSSVYISATLAYAGSVTTEGRFINFNADDKISVKINNQDFNLRFVKPVTIEVLRESDQDYRRRLLFAKTTGKANSLDQILLSSPQISGFNIYEDKINNKTIVSVLPTQYTLGTFSSSVADYVRSLIFKNAPYGSNVDVVYPQKVEVYVEFSLSDATAVPDETIKTVIKSELYNYYLYDTNNLLDCEAIKTRVEEVLQSLSGLTINNVAIYNETLGKYIFSTQDVIALPKEYFPYITDAETQITRI